MESSAPPACRHEYVKIYQRKIKGLERRLVATKAYLPVGFKMADFGHLSEGSYCFCTKCRARLFPKRTAADKAAARLANQQKIANAESLAAIEDLEDGEGIKDETTEESSKETSNSIHVEELEIIPLELEDLAESSSEMTASEEEDEG
ncbi:MAG: hypothetical protein K2X27_06640 [Candidatus Obscuribacterales bacterium]|nr:hypothetical protein [Candidatus Obscuribacterales bacterium]